MPHDESLYRALLEAAPDAIVMVDEAGVIQLVNAQAERLFGYTREEMLGRQIELLVPERFRQVHAKHRRGYAAAAHPRPMGAGLALHGRRRDGTEFPVEISLSPLTTDTGTFVASAIRDITDRQRIEAERLRLLRERAAHEEASRIKDEFIATLSHELRTPLNAILGWATLLASGRMSDSDTSRGLETIRRNANAQAKLIEDLLDMSRIMTGKLQLRNELIDLSGVVEDVVDVGRPSADARGVALDVMMELRPLLITGDAGRLQQAIWNVLSNAIKFTDRGGRVTVHLRATESEAVLTVRDTGRGIHPEFLPHVFDRFRQADSTYARQHGGLGLGLAIVKSLVELHGGAVSAHSSGEGTGAAFQLRIPRKRVVTSTSAWPRDVKADVVGLDGIRVLVVDDQPDERDLMRVILTAHHATVVVAGSADEALELMRTQLVDVVVSDLAMPDKDGYQLLAELRREFPRLPVMALTAHARDEDQQRALAAGFQMYLAKPVEPGAVTRAVASLLPPRAASPPTPQPSGGPGGNG